MLFRSIKQALQSGGISFIPSSDGTSFQVERSQVGMAKQAIQAEGLLSPDTPSVGGGLSLIEDAETKAFRIDAATRAQVIAAIQALDGVAQANVTSSRPRRANAFRDRDAEHKPSATIVLRLKSGAPFDPLAKAAAKLAS